MLKGKEAKRLDAIKEAKQQVKTVEKSLKFLEESYDSLDIKTLTEDELYFQREFLKIRIRDCKKVLDDQRKELARLENGGEASR